MLNLLKYVFVLLILTGFSYFSNIHAQIQFDLKASYYFELPYDTSVVITGNNYTHIGGFSGIDKNEKAHHYYLISDAHTGGNNIGDAQYYEVLINCEDQFTFEFVNTQKLKIPVIWSESIRSSKHGNFFISDERTIDNKERSQIFKIDQEGEFIEFNLPEKYKNEMYDNSGFEGIALSPNEDKVYVSLERAMPNCNYRTVTNILEYDTEDLNQLLNEYFYPLQRTEEGNGITEILAYNDSILFIMERDYVKPDNFVSVYSVNLNDLVEKPIEFNEFTSDVKFLNPKFLFTFNDVSKIGNKDFKVNNIEGFTFSTCGKYMIFVSDNNFGNKTNQTPTQIICLKIKKIETLY